ncbi:hypothetical protein [Orrella dioscoreae]|uniref:Uncharacterized protein n=1 Tax=Orrella dioscoreae TaxID=1851544 RepID=A0A1C3K7Q1_9BURK|nr:hypothetical protein [Orrella dioscoreae]SBT27540.1 phage-related hypothetical protein [Orrella dioscoreae]SOE48109.1 phage-related hypothetical protein [Orrella dioscoreae]
MADFPEYACILLQGYTETPDYGVLRTEMDNGIAKQRPTRSLAIVTRAATIHVGVLANKLLFDEWARTAISGGAGWFNWTDPLTQTVKQTRIVGGRYEWSSPGKVWRATCQIETVG